MVFKTTAIDHSAIPPRRISCQNRAILPLNGAPLVGLNVYMASYRFGKSVPEVFRAVLPIIVVLHLGVLLITYIPWLTTFLPSLFSTLVAGVVLAALKFAIDRAVMHHFGLQLQLVDL